MNTSFCLWLEELEDTFWRMNRGVYRFTCFRLPEWIYRQIVDTIGPAAIRLIRVAIAISVWLTVVIGPAVLTAKIGPESWGIVFAIVWLVLAVIGSVWGRSYLVKKRSSNQKDENSQPVPRSAEWRSLEDGIARS